MTEEEYHRALRAYAEKNGLPYRKAGASKKARPAVYPAEGRCTAGAVDYRTKVRALFDAMGGKPLIVRFSDDRTAILSAEALKFIPLSHEVLNA